MRTNLITFGSHGSYIDAVNRLVRQASALNIFTEVKGYTAEYLQDDEYFFVFVVLVQFQLKHFGL